jgi:hypothetical protein
LNPHFLERDYWTACPYVALITSGKARDTLETAAATDQMWRHLDNTSKRVEENWQSFVISVSRSSYMLLVEAQAELGRSLTSRCDPKIDVNERTAFYADADCRIDHRLIQAGKQFCGTWPLVESKGVILSRPDIRNLESPLVSTPCRLDELRLLKGAILRRQDNGAVLAVLYGSANATALRLEFDLQRKRSGWQVNILTLHFAISHSDGVEKIRRSR